MSVTKENLEKWLEIFGDLIETNKAYLSDLDTPIGDGDHEVITWLVVWLQLKKL